MEITFYGIRGSVPVPGADTNEYGGNTACVHVRTKNGYDIVLDAGTGICNLAKKFFGTPLGRGQGAVSLFLSHTHWDHIQGLPFFIPIFIPGNQIYIYGGPTGGKDLRSILEGQLMRTYSPIYSLSNLGANLTIKELSDETLTIDGVSIKHERMSHSSTDSTAYRLEEDGKALVYMTDVEHRTGQIDQRALALAEDAHILIHDTHFSPEDYAKSQGRGHSSIEAAIGLAQRAKVKELVMFHYSPDYTDDDVRDLYQRFHDQSAFNLVAGREGLRLVL